jgi:hypothetical protein
VIAIVRRTFAPAAANRVSAITLVMDCDLSSRLCGTLYLELAD